MTEVPFRRSKVGWSKWIVVSLGGNRSLLRVVRNVVDQATIWDEEGVESQYKGRLSRSQWKKI